jgi:hypothetical protein
MGALGAMQPQRVKGLLALTVGHPSGFFADPIGQRERSWNMLFFQTPGVAEAALRLIRAFVSRAGAVSLAA